MKGMLAWKGYRKHKQDHNTLLCCITWKTTTVLHHMENNNRPSLMNTRAPTNLHFVIDELVVGPLPLLQGQSSMVWQAWSTQTWHTHKQLWCQKWSGRKYIYLPSLTIYVHVYLHHEKPVYINMYTGNILQHMTQLGTGLNDTKLKFLSPCWNLF